ncbi:invasion associated locus B family protein [Xanthobacter sp. KR7-65]|uniref:invasion associated locus B family protein n=1 Tax=Xanthobacter sp. KR7-65 TaxID=3156612 RepID=UPI0032B516F0
MALSDLLPTLRIAVLPAAALAGLAVVTPAAAQTAKAPSETRSTHDDWAVRCAGADAKRECEAVQTLQTADLKGILAHVAVRAEKSGPIRLIVLTPPGVWLPSNVTLKVSGVADVVLTFKRCGQHCVASTELTDPQVTALKASAGKGELVFENGSRQPIILPVSFKGLGAALEASLKG